MTESKKPRVRFAPSPTGHLHVGNARTALFNWLFASKQDGVMILRIEDTDLERSEARFEAQLVKDLHWLGLNWDEGPEVKTDSGEVVAKASGAFGPYRQSERLEIYHEQAERLLREGKAYLCFCTNEELEAERHRAIADHKPQVYSGKCRKHDPADAAKRRASGEQAAIRLRIPEHPIRFHDIVHGAVELSNEVVSDPIIMRSSGVPVYNYVVVVDDALMQITHVIRGDDHLSNTPKQVALYEALGWPAPEFAHLSTILGSDRERLSKRHGATSIANFREMGVLPEALVNYLALLGWAPSGGDREIFTLAELAKEFDLRRVTPSAAVFDMEKLKWLDRHYIKIFLQGTAIMSQTESVSPDVRRKLDASSKLDQEYSSGYQVILSAWHHFVKVGYLPALSDSDDAQLRWFVRILFLLGPSVDMFEELPGRAIFFFHYSPQAALTAPDNAEVLAMPKTKDVVAAFSKRALAETELTAERFKAIMNEVKAETSAKGKELFHPVRIVLTGSHSGPEFDKTIPLIESGSKLNLPKHVKSVKERVQEFMRSV